MYTVYSDKEGTVHISADLCLTRTNLKTKSDLVLTLEPCSGICIYCFKELENKIPIIRECIKTCDDGSQLVIHSKYLLCDNDREMDINNVKKIHWRHYMIKAISECGLISPGLLDLTDIDPDQDRKTSYGIILFSHDEEGKPIFLIHERRDTYEYRNFLTLEWNTIADVRQMCV